MIKLIFITAIVLCSLVAKAQTSTSTATASTSTTKKDGKLTSHNSVSVSNSDQAYSLRAEFNVDDYSKIKSVLEKNLERNYRTESANTIKWSKEENAQTAYSFILTGNKLKINVDKDLVSDATFEKLKGLGTKLSAIISAKKD
jgi:hypothetical protein